MTANPLLPFRQGELDGLCGVYAALNAVRLLLGNSGVRLTSENWHALFAELLVCADDYLGAAQAAINGVQTRYFRKLLTVITVHLRDQHDIDVGWTRLVAANDRPSINLTLDRFRQSVEDPNQTIVFTVEGFISHWTVLRRVANQYLVLFDSSGYNRLMLSNCRMPYEPARSSREHIIPPDAAFLIKLERR